MYLYFHIIEWCIHNWSSFSLKSLLIVSLFGLVNLGRLVKPHSPSCIIKPPKPSTSHSFSAIIFTPFYCILHSFFQQRAWTTSQLILELRTPSLCLMWSTSLNGIHLVSSRIKGKITWRIEWGEWRRSWGYGDGRVC